MKKITEVHVQAYRGLRDLRMTDMADINVLIGPTNTGKSSLLEAVWLASNPVDIGSHLHTAVKNRSLAGEASIRSLFPNLDPGNEIAMQLNLLMEAQAQEATLTIRDPKAIDSAYLDILVKKGRTPDKFTVLEVVAHAKGDGLSGNLTLQFGVRASDGIVDPEHISSGESFALLHEVAYFIPSELNAPSIFDDAYSKAYLSGTLPDLLEALRLVYGKVEDIRPVKVEGDRWMTYVQLSGRTMPLIAMGDGFRAAVVLLSYALGKGLMLLDTPEAFQHVKGLEAVSKALVAAASKLDNQVILATQSLELLDMFLKESAEKEMPLNVYRLSMSDDQIVAYPPLSGESAWESRRLIGADLRR